MQSDGREFKNSKGVQEAKISENVQSSVQHNQYISKESLELSTNFAHSAEQKQQKIILKSHIGVLLMKKQIFFVYSWIFAGDLFHVSKVYDEISTFDRWTC